MINQTQPRWEKLVKHLESMPKKDFNIGNLWQCVIGQSRQIFPNLFGLNGTS